MKPVSRLLPEDGGVGGPGALGAEPTGRLRPVGIRDVAALARVSPATASRALNGDKTVHRLMRDRVFAAAERLSYRPNPLARNLRRQRTSAIGVVVAAIDMLQTSMR
jgi:LacI family transcriptional regulator